MSTEPQTAGTNANDTGAAAAAPPAVDTLLTEGNAPIESSTPPVKDGEPAGGDKTVDGAPPEYSDFALPEGLEVNQDVMASFKEFAKTKNLSQEDAQKFTDMGAQLVQSVEAKYASQVEAVKVSWAKASTTDAEFGGDALGENLAVAKKALDAFGTPELSAFLKDTGLGNHPEMIRAFYRVGKSISGDRLVPGGQSQPAKDPLKTMYPSMDK